MSRLKYILLLSAIFYKSANSAAVNLGESPEDPLYLTDYLELGQVEQAQRKAEVKFDGFEDVKSYSGYITIDKKINSNTFFWFVLSQENPSKAPLLVWLAGGPGSSTMDNFFNANGPFTITKNMSIARRQHALTKNHNVIYIDNPLGAGFSFTTRKSGFVRNQDEVGHDLLVFIKQFFKIFPEYTDNDFYVAGDSYGGKFSVTMAKAIRDYNRNGQWKINLKGILLGNSLIDPVVQEMHADFLYHIGMIDENEHKRIQDIDDELVDLKRYASIDNETQVNEKFMDRITTKHNLIYELTGFQQLHNYLKPLEKADREYFVQWINLPETRRILHVGNATYDYFNNSTKSYLYVDLGKSVAPILADHLDHVKVLIFNGQLDMDFPYSSSQHLYRSLIWSGAEEYRQAKKSLWYVDGELAGFEKRAKNFWEVFVRSAGHICAFEQPKWMCDLITRFTSTPYSFTSSDDSDY